MATIKTKKDWTHTEEQEQDVVDPDYDEASDPDYEAGADPDYDEASDPDYEAGADPDYNDDFRDLEAEESSQEWRYRPQR